MPQVLDRPKHLAPSFPRLRYITHPLATAEIPTSRYIVTARLFDEEGFGTDTLREFDVLMPYYLTSNSAIERLLKTVTNDRYQVSEKVEQVARF